MKILFATGGSGGHIFPALKTAEQLKSEGHEVVFAGALASAEDRLRRAGFSSIILDVEGLNKRSLVSIFSFGYLMTKAIVRSLGIVRSLKPDAVVGFGSYSSFPVVFAACLLRVPAMLHEQNVTPGKANRLSARFVRRIAVTFEETKKYFPGREVVWTGCPCNTEQPSKSKDELLGKFNFKPNRLTILVLGGSQGSRYLNEVFFEAIPHLQAGQNIQVIHSTGKMDYPVYVEGYKGSNIGYHVCAFMDNIQDAYGVADVVVARSGAATVCELAAFGLPSILVPYPFAHSHQTANARVLEGAGTAVVIEQKDLSCQKILDAIEHLRKEGLNPPVVRKRVERFFVNNPTERLVQAITSLKR